MRTILVIDDNPAVGTALDLLLSLHEIRVLAPRSPEEGLAILERELIDLVIADMNFDSDTTSGAEGVALFHAIRQRHPDLPVILLTAWTNLETAVQLVKAGAADYLSKPWDDVKLVATIENLLELSEVTQERQRARRVRRRRSAELRANYNLLDVVYVSEAMERSLEMACRVARASAAVFVSGPSGAGKECIARIIHENSGLQGPFVAINCGAIPTELIEAELFGVTAGAFTGAVHSREGRFEAANGGTLFLDEIANLTLPGQVKLLRILETGEFQRLGSVETLTAKTRVISATNASLAELVRDGRFREDLFYRLNVIEIAVPPLSERPEDVIPLAEHFLGDARELAPDARTALLGHTWPGNVRELKNVIERAKVLAVAPVIIGADLQLPAATRIAADIEQIDAVQIETALRSSSGIVSRAAKKLGLSRQALYRRMQVLGLRE